MENQNKIPLDWKIELDNHVGLMMVHARKIMDIIATLPKPSEHFKAKADGVYAVLKLTENNTGLKNMDENSKWGGKTTSPRGSEHPL